MGTVEFGYAVNALEQVNLTPFARLEAGSVSRDAFSETGSGILDLSAPAQDAGATQSVLGARLGSDLPLAGLLLKADFSLGWSHELSNQARTALLSFAGTPGTNFTVAGAALPGDAADVGLGLSTGLSDTGLAYLRYDGDYSSRSASHAFTIGFRFSW
jgi:outer membrane autotransporter protein